MSSIKWGVSLPWGDQTRLCIPRSFPYSPPCVGTQRPGVPELPPPDVVSVGRFWSQCRSAQHLQPHKRRQDPVVVAWGALQLLRLAVLQRPHDALPGQKWRPPPPAPVPVCEQSLAADERTWDFLQWKLDDATTQVARPSESWRAYHVS